MGVKMRIFGKRLKKKPTVKLESNLCSLCDRDSKEPYLGQLLCESNLYVHENCLFFSPVLIQELDPSNKKRGYILGFKITDIEKEVKRIIRLKCKICKKRKGGIGCCMPNCKRSFHLDCGLKNNAVGIFNDSFHFYCNEHAQRQDLTNEISLCNKTIPECTICLDVVTEDGHEEDTQACDQTVWGRFLDKIRQRQVMHGLCCTRSWLHRDCMSRYGLSAGLHHVKCPNCGNTASFVDTVQKCGIWLPDRDASWELEPGAFQEMYEVSTEHTNEDGPRTRGQRLSDVPDTTSIDPSLSSSSSFRCPEDTNNENSKQTKVPSPDRVVQSSQVDSKTSPDSLKLSLSTTGTASFLEPKSRKRKSLGHVTVKSPNPFIKRRKSKDKPTTVAPLITRQCSRCSKSLVCFSYGQKPRTSPRVLKDSNCNQDDSCQATNQYVCVSCHQDS